MFEMLALPQNVQVYLACWVISICTVRFSQCPTSYLYDGGAPFSPAYAGTHRNAEYTQRPISPAVHWAQA